MRSAACVSKADVIQSSCPGVRRRRPGPSGSVDHPPPGRRRPQRPLSVILGHRCANTGPFDPRPDVVGESGPVGRRDRELMPPSPREHPPPKLPRDIRSSMSTLSRYRGCLDAGGESAPAGPPGTQTPATPALPPAAAAAPGETYCPVRQPLSPCRQRLAFTGWPSRARHRGSVPQDQKMFELTAARATVNSNISN